MPETDHWIGIKGYRVVERTEVPPLRVVAEPRTKPTCCVHCGGEHLHSKGRYRRQVRHLRSFGARVSLVIVCRRFKCLACGQSFVQRLPGIRPGRHSSEPFREQVYQQHQDGVCGSKLAAHFRIGTATVERIYSQFTARKAKERRARLCPLVLGIDEHTLHKKCRFATTLCDLRNHCVFDVAEGKSSKELERFLASLQGRKRVRVVCIDMSSTYRALVRRYFPKARIVADRFHVVRLVIHHFMELLRSIDPTMSYQRGYLAILRKRPDRLTLPQRERRDELFTRCPALHAIYEQMQKVCALMREKTRSKRQCRPLVDRFLRQIEELKQSGFGPMLTLAKTLSSWQEEIACMWRFTKNNGITEGFHRKMKLIQRRAYGFRNFENYRLRVIAQCG